MGQGMPIFVIFPSKPLLMIFTRYNGAFLGPLRLVSEHVRFEVLDNSTAINVWASASLFTFFVEAKTCRPGTFLRCAREARCDRHSSRF